MAAKKPRAGERAVKGKLREVKRNTCVGIGKRRTTRACTLTLQARASSEDSAERLDGETSSPVVVKQGIEHEKPRRARGVKLVEEVLQYGFGLPGQSRTRRACTRSGGRNGVVPVGLGDQDFKMKENFLQIVAFGNWTEQQEKALAESLAIVKAGANFWNRIAEQVPGRNAEECSEKFYSGRTATRAATRSCTEDLPLARIKSSRCVAPLRSKKSTNARNSEQELSTPKEAPAKGRVVKQIKRQVIKRRVGGISTLADVEQVPTEKQENNQKANSDVKVSQMAKKGSRNRAGMQDLVEKPEDRVGSTKDVALASGFDQASTLEDANRGTECASLAENSDVWTSVQEAALQDAYATTKPSANFWHLISKQVPGRNEEECFNKFYSSHPTPPCAVAAQRTCLKEVEIPSLQPNQLQPRKTKTTRAKRLLEAHQMVRNILRRQQVNDEDYKADAFAALEPPDVVDSVMGKAIEDESGILSDAEFEFFVQSSLHGSTENSMTQHGQSDKENWKPKMTSQQQRGSGMATQLQVFSPEILKKVKDPLMLDKYIDHLHQRRSRRPGIKSAQRNNKRANAAEDYSKDGFNFGEVRLDAIHRAKQELRDVFLRPGSIVDDPFLDLLSDSTDDEEEDEVDDSFEDSRIDPDQSFRFRV